MTTMEQELVILRALGALLGYPGAELREALPEIAEAVHVSRLIGSGDRAALLALIDDLARLDPIAAEEAYLELFDRGRSTSLYLFEHVHGDARDRGAAMVELNQLYATAGFELARRELPDYLPVVLEYLSCRTHDEVRAMLDDCAHILRLIGEVLTKRASGYAAVFQTLLAIAGAPALDAARARRRALEKDDLDRDWEEQPAFAPAPPGAATADSGGCR
jgi:nitrate reductase molybdenum cofactor assembly chaperone NarJ/NarW